MNTITVAIAPMLRAMLTLVSRITIAGSIIIIFTQTL